MLKTLRRIKHRLSSTARHEELLLHNALWKMSHKGTMIDVGAHCGGSLWPFALDGWRVFALEPDPKNRRALESLVGDFTKVKIDSRAVSEADGQELPFFQSDVSTGISSLSAFHKSHTASSTIVTVRLDTFCSLHNVDAIDFLKIDIEGHDLFALRSHNWDLRPDVVMCEFEDRKTETLGHKTSAIADLLISKSYIVVVSEWCPIVEYGRIHQWRRAYEYNGSVPSDSWGNLIGLSTREQADKVLGKFASWR